MAHRAGKLKQAERMYRKLLAARPDLGSAWNGLGALLAESGRPEQAEYAYKRAVTAAQPYPKALYNLAISHYEHGKLKKAADLLHDLLEKEPLFSYTWNSLGVIYKDNGDPEKALECFERALELMPDFAEAWNNKGTLLDAKGKAEEAVSAFKRALQAAPGYSTALFNLAQAYHRSGKRKEAERCYRKVLEIDPEHSQAAFLLKSLEPGAEGAPDAPPIEYVQGLFDQCAAEFDDILVKQLRYEAPKRLYDLARPYLKKGMIILDLGCGTGLAGPLLAKHASHLAGLDLSANMLKQAEATGCYDMLVQADMLGNWGMDPLFFDLIYSADVLVYTGDLIPVFKKCYSHLKSQGLWVFSVEKLDTHGGFKLLPSCRYGHSEKYVADALAQSGFKIMANRDCILRHEQGRPVNGKMFVAQKR